MVWTRVNREWFFVGFHHNVLNDSQGHYQTEGSEQLKELFCVPKAELNVPLDIAEAKV